MFTGIITNTGKLVHKENALFTFQTDALLCQKIDNGTSISVNGVCLTVFAKTAETFSVEIMPETEEKTMLGNLQIHDVVNLELPVTPQTFLSGHIVQGHVDDIGKLKHIGEKENSKILTIEINSDLSKYIVEKGSIAMNGISLTIIDITKTSFTAGIIPYTWKHTMLHMIKIGDSVNIEVDILGKYIMRKEESYETNQRCTNCRCQ